MALLFLWNFSPCDVKSLIFRELCRTYSLHWTFLHENGSVKELQQMLLSMLRSDFCLGFQGKCTLLVQHSDGVCEGIFIHPFPIAFEPSANFNQIWLRTSGLSTWRSYKFFQNRQLGEKEKRGSITAFIEEKAEAWGQFLTDIKESTWRNDAMNDPWVKKSTRGKFHLIKQQKIQIQGKLDFVISTA